MKRFFFISLFAFLLLAYCAGSAFAQDAGYEHPAASSSCLNHLQVGANIVPKMPSTLDLNPNRSFHLSMDIYDINVPLNAAQTVNFSAGIRYVYDDYVFSDNISVVVENGQLTPFSISSSYKKSKLAAHYMGIPVYLNINAAQDLTISVGAYADYLLGSYTKYKKPKHKDNIRCFNTLQAGVVAEIVYNGFGVYAQYALVPLFKDTVGPNVHTLSMGVVYGF